MRPKVTVPPCRFCSKKFQRTEHLNRHERTHTKEKPFACACGKSFSRQDLLARHERRDHNSNLEHPEDLSYQDGASRLQSRRPTAQGEDSLSEDDDESTARAQSDASFRQGGLLNQETFTTIPKSRSRAAEFVPNEQQSPLQSFGLNSTCATDPNAFGDDLDFLWDHFDMNSTAIDPSVLNYPMNFPMFPEQGLQRNTGAPFGATQNLCVSENARELDGDGAISRYGSRLPSPIGSESERPSSGNPGPAPSISSRQPPALVLSGDHRPWRISRSEYDMMRCAVEATDPVRVGGFKMPSRHALNRYVEGYFSGFHEHLPFLHLPTTHMPTAAPELIIAIVAVGAQYRFQREQGLQLCECARALISWRLAELDQPPKDDIHARNYDFTPQSGGGTVASSSNNPSPALGFLQNSPTGRPSVDATTQLLQAMIMIMALGTWNQPRDLKKSVHLGMQLAVLLRESGLTEPAVPSMNLTWEEWVILESQRRTKLVAYCFLNLHSIAYNWSPQILNDSIELNLPCGENIWRAEDAVTWATLRSQDLASDISFKQAYESLFEKQQRDQAGRRFSSFGTYIMAHAILQQVFYARQATPSFEGGKTASLPENALNVLEEALSRWQKNWESSEDSFIDPSSPSGPLSFNSTALFRLAYVRMHADLGAYRRLETFDPVRIAHSLSQVPHLARSVHVFRAVLQCIHSLSIPVRIGIEFVSRTHSWSIIHSLCNFECAAFLSQWLNCVATKTGDGQVALDGELRLAHLVQGVLRETSFGQEIDDEENLSRRCKRMAAAVAQVCSQTLRGAHVWQIMDVMATALERRADMF